MKKESQEALGIPEEDTKHPLASLTEKEVLTVVPLHELLKLCGVDIVNDKRAAGLVVQVLKSLSLLAFVFWVTDSGVCGLCAMAFDIVSFTVVAPGASPGTAMAVVAGDSAQARNSSMATMQNGLVKPRRIITCAAWTKAQAVGLTQVVWPSGADQVRGNRFRNTVNTPQNVVPKGVGWRLRPQDPITVTEIGSATAGDVELFHMLNWYEDLPGVAGRLLSWQDVQKRAVQCVTIEDTTTAAAASTYAGSRALNAASDLLLPDTDYAIIGGIVGVACGALCLQGVDNGGLRWGFPGNPTGVEETSSFFWNLAREYDLPMIPVINSANRAGTFITNVQDENLTAVPFSLSLVQLDRRFETQIETPPIIGGPPVPPAT